MARQNSPRAVAFMRRSTLRDLCTVAAIRDARCGKNDRLSLESTRSEEGPGSPSPSPSFPTPTSARFKFKFQDVHRRLGQGPR